jgi:signal peptidase II
MDSLHGTEARGDEPDQLVSARTRGLPVRRKSHLRRYAALLGCALAVFAADQVLKALVIRSLRHGGVIDLAGGLVRIDFVRNSGAAFGLFPSGSFMFAAVAILVCLGILTFYNRIADSAFPLRLALGLILGGALGNLADRVRLGYVVDYVDLRWWYVFNLADSAIVIGVAILLLLSSLDSRTRPE